MAEEVTTDLEDQIGKTITSTLAATEGLTVPFFLYEAEVDVYPYAVYYYNPEFFSTKDGVYKIAADVTLQVYSQDFDQAYANAVTIKDALIAGMNSNGFRTRVSTTSKECVEGVWNVEIVYNIIQMV